MMRKLFPVAVGVVLLAAAAPGNAVAADQIQVNSRVAGTVVPPNLKCVDAVPSIGVLACYERNGDKMWLRDTRADGHHVDMFFAVAEKGGICNNYHGSAAGWTVCDQLANFVPEHQQIMFKGKVMEGSRLIAETDFVIDRTT